MYFLSLATISVVVAFCFADPTNDMNPRVNTSSGTVEGFVKTVPVGENRTVDLNVFLGIPYAEPPVGDMRFRRTAAKKKMSGVFNATVYGHVCPQNRSSLTRLAPAASVVSEDCLILNIYAPTDVSNDTVRPTMVWVHGGSYNSGTANIYDGSLVSAFGDVVVVAINYRLGALGYFSTADQSSWGNYGAYDQQEALLWVANNIREFGGDPGNITLFGESAGASSVSLLTFNTPTNLFIRRVIVESGTALVSWAMVDNPKKNANQFALFADCSGQSQQMVDCLRNRSIDDIIRYQDQMEAVRGGIGGLSFGPVVDHQLFLYTSQELATGRAPPFFYERFASIDHLIGTNSQEGAFIYNQRMAPYRHKLRLNDSITGLPESVFRGMVNQSAHEMSPDHGTQLTPVLENKYTDYRNLDDGIRRAAKFIDALTDNVFYSGIVPFVDLHASRSSNSSHGAGSTYFYLFDHRGSWMSHEPWRTGADHGNELLFVFGYPFIAPSLPEEKALSLAMITFWTNFAKTGNPNLPEKPRYSAEWPEYQVGEEKYIRLAIGGALTGEKFAADRVAFWTDFLPKFLASFPPPPKCPVVPVAPKCNGAVTMLSLSNVLLLCFAIFTVPVTLMRL